MIGREGTMRTRPVELSPLFEQRHLECLALLDAERNGPVVAGDIVAGKYRVDHVLGGGAMGVVVAGTHVDLDHKVAIKFVRPSVLNEPEQQERFVREARTLARLKSVHVAKVLDVGKMASGVPFMVMELLEGCDLAALLAEHGPLSFDHAADYVAQACEAVAEAHALGVVHRDIKPQNLFLTSSVGGGSLVKVLDFGVSKIGAAGFASLTQSTTVIGSPLYMSPEQMRCSRDADSRSDVWSLGVVLFELLTGRPPFDADSMPALCLKVVNDLPPSMERAPREVPAGLVSVVMRCLAKDPAQRFRDAGELGAALAPFAVAPLAASVSRALVVSGLRRTQASVASHHSVAPRASMPEAHASPRGSSRRRVALLLVIMVTALIAGFLLVRGVATHARARAQKATTSQPANAEASRGEADKPREPPPPPAITLAPLAPSSPSGITNAPPRAQAPSPKVVATPAAKPSATPPHTTPVVNDDDIPAFR
jgi:serine/threonine protein kinase